MSLVSRFDTFCRLCLCSSIMTSSIGLRSICSIRDILSYTHSYHLASTMRNCLNSWLGLLYSTFVQHGSGKYEANRNHADYNAPKNLVNGASPTGTTVFAWEGRQSTRPHVRDGDAGGYTPYPNGVETESGDKPNSQRANPSE